MLKKYLTYGMLLVGSVGLIACANTEEDMDETTDESTEVINEEEHGLDLEDYPEIDSDYEAQYTTSVNQELIDEHDNRYQEITEDFQNGDYTFEEPLVVQDPYDRSPLSALVLFETEEPTEITVTVEGQDEHTTISNTYSGYEIEHEVPVLGLYPNLDNKVILKAVSEKGNTEEIHLSMNTDEVPEEARFDLSIVESQPERMEDGLTFLSPSRAYPAGIDNNGEVRWYTPYVTSNHFSRLDNEKLLIVTMEEDREHYDTLSEMDMLGRVHQSITVDMDNVIASNPFHHDVILLPNDNYLALLHDGSDEYVEDEIVELDRETGEVVHRINLKDVFPSEMYEDYEGPSSDVGDWVHVNAIWKLENEDAVLLSVRQQDTILKMTYPEGEIDWMFAYPEGWSEDLEGYLLESSDEYLKYPAGQHAVMELTDQDEDEKTLDIMLFDNNTIYSRGDKEVNEEYSRAVQYRINQENHIVEEIWSYGEERGEELYTGIVSDADPMPESGNALINFGRTLDEDVGERYSVITEVTKTEEPEVVYELKYGSFGEDEYYQNYRAERFPLYPKN